MISKKILSISLCILKKKKNLILYYIILLIYLTFNSKGIKGCLILINKAIESF